MYFLKIENWCPGLNQDLGCPMGRLSQSSIGKLIYHSQTSLIFIRIQTNNFWLEKSVPMMLNNLNMNSEEYLDI